MSHPPIILDRRVTVHVRGDNEITSYPWWAILTPRQVMRKDPHQISCCIVGPFFSRESAEEQRKRRIYAYGQNSVVFCFSGHESPEWRDANNLAQEASKRKHFPADRADACAAALDGIADPAAFVAAAIKLRESSQRAINVPTGQNMNIFHSDAMDFDKAKG